MHKISSVKRNIIYNSMYQLFAFITPLITAPYTARVLGASGIGLQSFVGSITSYFLLFATMGTSTYGQREVAMSKDDLALRSKKFWEITMVNAITTCIVLVAWMILISFSNKYKFYYLVSTITIVAAFFDISWFYAGIEQFGTIVGRNIVIRIIGIICLFTFIRSSTDLALYIAILASSSLLGNLSMWLGLKTRVSRIDIHTIRLRTHFRETFVYFIPTIAVSVYTILNKTMLGFLTVGTVQNGYYEQANKLVDLAKSMILSINTVMYTRMSYLFKNGKKQEMRTRLSISLNLISFASIPVICGMIAISPILVPLFFGKGYDGVIPLIDMCMPLVLVIGLSNCLGQQYLTPTGQRAKTNIVVIIGAAVNLVANLAFIPEMGAKGAAIGTILSEVVILILYLKMSISEIDIHSHFQSISKRCASGIVMIFIVRMLAKSLGGNLFSLLIEVFCGAAVYIIGLLVSHDDVMFGFLNRYVLRRKSV